MDELAGRNLRLDGVEEADELLMAVALHVAADHRAVEHVERGEQRGGAVALVVMGHGAGAALLHRQAGLGAVERLDLALLVDAEHDGVRRRIDIEPDDVAQLGDEVRIVGELELAHAVRLKPVRAPDALHRADARRRRPSPSSRRSSGSPRPAGRLASRRRPARPRPARAAGCATAGSCRASRPSTPSSHEPLLPAPDAGLRLAGPAHDLVRADAVGGQQHDPRPPDMLLGRVPILDDGLKPLAIGRRNVMEIPVRMRQTRTRKKRQESLQGLNRQILSTRTRSRRAAQQ